MSLDDDALPSSLFILFFSLYLVTYITYKPTPCWDKEVLLSPSLRKSCPYPIASHRSSWFNQAGFRSIRPGASRDSYNIQESHAIADRWIACPLSVQRGRPRPLGPGKSWCGKRKFLRLVFDDSSKQWEAWDEEEEDGASK